MKETTITAREFDRLSEARRLQIERYRTKHFKEAGKLPSDTDPLIDGTWLAVNYEGEARAVPVKLLTQWANTLDQAAPLVFTIDATGSLTIKRGSSSLRTFAPVLKPIAPDLPGVLHFGGTYRGGQTPCFPDAPVALTVEHGQIAVALPDIAAELKALAGETTANRKQIAKEKAIAKARKAERAALDKLTKATDEANQAQAVIDGQTLKEAVTFARRCLSARRLFRSTLASLETIPAWLPITYEGDDWTQGERRPIICDTLTHYREYLDTLIAARAAREAYKPRNEWPSWMKYHTEKEGISLAVYRKANPQHAFKVYGPAFDKLKEAEKRECDKLSWFVKARFAEYCTAQGLPDSLSIVEPWSMLRNCRAYSRARLLLADWPGVCEQLTTEHRETVEVREKAEA